MNFQQKELQGDHALWQVLGMSEAQEAGLYLCGEGWRVGGRGERIGKWGWGEGRERERGDSKRQGREENGCEHRLCSLQPDRLGFES